MVNSDAAVKDPNRETKPAYRGGEDGGKAPTSVGGREKRKEENSQKGSQDVKPAILDISQGGGIPSPDSLGSLEEGGVFLQPVGDRGVSPLQISEGKTKIRSSL